MDPNANLEEQRRIAEHLLETSDDPDASPDVYRLAELVLALDGWLSKGGFPPNAWKPKGLSETQLAARRFYGWDKP